MKSLNQKATTDQKSSTCTVKKQKYRRSKAMCSLNNSTMFLLLSHYGICYLIIIVNRKVINYHTIWKSMMNTIMGALEIT